MKLVNLTESSGEQVLAFSDEIDDLERAAAENESSKVKPDTFAAMRKLGTNMFKAGMEFNHQTPDELSFDKTLVSGATITIWLVYKMNGVWGIHVEGTDGGDTYEWEGATVQEAAKLDINKLLDKVDAYFGTIDELKLLLGSKPKKQV